MITYAEACKAVNYEQKCTTEPQHIYKFYGYKEGKAELFDSVEDAKKFSKNTERVHLNKDEIDAFWNNQRSLEMKAANVWHTALREEFSYISDDLFGECYSEAYDRDNTAGYDEVYSNMCNVVEFAQKILKIGK